METFKKEFAHRKGIHLNNAGMAPVSHSVSRKLISLAEASENLGSFNDATWVPEIRETRERLANFIGADSTQIAFTQNCASALSQAALGFQNLSEGDEVITLDQEYASNFYPWKVACERAGAHLHVIDTSVAMLAPANTLTDLVLEALQARSKVARVKIVALSWVQFQTGVMVDLKKMGDACHAVGAYLVVDAIQGLGQLPFDFKNLPVDFVAGGSHKWMCGINGQGFFAVKESFMAELQPTLVGSGTFNRFGTFATLDAAVELSARKFEPGGFAYFSLFALNEAIKVQQAVGKEKIAQEIFRFTQKLRTRLLECGVKLATPFDQKNGITSIVLPADQELSFLQRCKEAQISLAKRGSYLRISAHAFHQDSEIEKLIEVLES